MTKLYKKKFLLSIIKDSGIKPGSCLKGVFGFDFTGYGGYTVIIEHMVTSGMAFMAVGCINHFHAVSEDKAAI